MRGSQGWLLALTLTLGCADRIASTEVILDAGERPPISRADVRVYRSTKPVDLVIVATMLLDGGRQPDLAALYDVLRARAVELRANTVLIEIRGTAAPSELDTARRLRVTVESLAGGGGYDEVARPMQSAVIAVTFAHDGHHVSSASEAEP